MSRVDMHVIFFLLTLLSKKKVRVVSVAQRPCRFGPQSVLCPRVCFSVCHRHGLCVNDAVDEPRNDPTPDRGAQLPRAATLIISSLGFVHDLRAGILEPDKVRGVPLDMDQHARMFGTARIPTEVCTPLTSTHQNQLIIVEQRGCRMQTNPESRHVVVLRRGQFCTCACGLRICSR
jgi:hypothetical protein